MKNFIAGIIVAATVAAAAYGYTVDWNNVGLVVINNAIGLLYSLEAVLLT